VDKKESRDLPYIHQGRRLREARFYLGNEGQAAFGQRLGGFTVAQISQAERGRNLPPSKMLHALAKQRIDINYILAGEGGVTQTRHGGACPSSADSRGRAGTLRAPSDPAVEGVLRTGGILRIGPIEVAFNGTTLVVRDLDAPIVVLARWDGGYRFIARPNGSAYPELIDPPPSDLPLVSIGQGDSRREIREEDLLP